MKQDPFTGSIIASLSAASEKDVQLAVDAAAKAQPAWAAQPALKRASVLRKFALLMEENAHKLAEVGKTDPSY